MSAERQQCLRTPPLADCRTSDLTDNSSGEYRVKSVAAFLLILAVMASHGIKQLLRVVADAVLEHGFDVLDIVDVA